jgi:ABC-2 type transport system permease protein
MSSIRQVWLVARRELRERIRSRGLWAGTVIMLFVVVAAIVVPAALDGGAGAKDVGFVGAAPEDLGSVTRSQGEAVGVTVHVHRYRSVAAGEQAVRDDDIDVLLVDTRVLKWQGDPDEQLRAVVTSAVQVANVQKRADAAGISPEELAALTAPVPVRNQELGSVGSRSPDDETAAYVMSILLLVAMATYGQLVLTGVVQEKSSRVVEVLLARMPARNLLAGKIAGIGLLGFAQFAAVALAALVATMLVDAVHIPAISITVLGWTVLWFVLGYAMYAMSYGAVGSLASRTEDASSIAAPVTAVLIVGYWASLVAVGSDPESSWSRLASLFPATAPFAMPGRIALGAAAAWEMALAVVLTGRVYTGAILSGATIRLRDAWARADVASAEDASERRGGSRFAHAVLVAVAIALGAGVFALAGDFIIGVAAGACFYAVSSRVARKQRGPVTDGAGHAVRR